MKINKTKGTSGFTLAELIIVFALFGMLSVVVMRTLSGKNPKSECLNAGGSWTEGVQFGRYSQYCVYPSNKGQ